MTDINLKILRSLGAKKKVLIGKGGEGDVYELDEKRVVKIYGKADESYIKSLKSFQSKLAQHDFSFQTPQIFEIRTVEKKLVTIEKKLSGVNGEELFVKINDADRKVLLSNFFEGVDEIAGVQLNDYNFGQIITRIDSVTSINWPDYLIEKLEQRLRRSKTQLKSDVTNLKEKIELLKKVVRTELAVVPKNLVHHDYYLNNVLVTKDLKLSAVLDFSTHTVVGDWRMDVAGAVTFLGINNKAKNYIPYMNSLAKKKYGNGILKVINLYLLYYSIYYSDTYKFDMVSYNWCVNNLNNKNLWISVEH